MIKKNKILILGAGFGGIKCAKDLSNKFGKNHDISIINKGTHMEYYPGIYKIATGKIPLESCIPLEKVFREDDVNLIIDTIVSVDLQNKKVICQNSVQEYDILVFALGSVFSDFGIPGIKENAFSFKSVADAIKIKKHIHNLFANYDEFVKEENFDKENKERLDHYFNFVIIGGGPSGVELTGELTQYVIELSKKHNVDYSLVHIDLIESAPSLLANQPKKISNLVYQKLSSLGVSIFLNHRVLKQVENELFLDDITIKANTTIWTAGVAPSPLYKDIQKLNLDKKGRIIVDEKMKATGTENVFVIGDSASTAFAGTAQTALYDGEFVANQIANQIKGKKLKDYKPKKNQLAIPVYHCYGIVSAFGFVIFGKIAYLIREFIDLSYFLSILKPKEAFRIWKNGDKISRDCPICKED